MTQAATSSHEVPFWVDTPDGHALFGILTTPTVEPNGIAVVLATGGSRAPSFGRNRTWTDSARRWAALGFHTVRFAFRTTGESTGSEAVYLLGDPWDGDVRAVTDWVLARQEVDRVVMAGICFGARSQLKAAADIEELAGFAAIPVPVRDFGQGESTSSYPLSWYVKQLVRPRSWKRLLEKEQRAGAMRIIRRRVRRLLGKMGLKGAQKQKGPAPAVSGVSQTFVEQLRDLSRRQVPVLLSYGSRDKFWEDFQEAMRLHPDLTEAESVEVDVADGMYLHGMRTIETQQWIIERLERFLVERVVGARSESS